MKINKIFIFTIVANLFFLIGCKNDSKQKKKQTNYSEVMLKLFSINTSNDFIIAIPKTGVNCKLTQIINTNTSHLAKGNYVDGVEKGEVYLDYSNVITLKSSSQNNIELIIPFSVSNSGPGIFKYLGLFELNTTKGIIKHKSSKFLGDRIDLYDLQYDGNKKINIKIKDKKANPSFSTKDISFLITKGEIQG